MRFILVLLAIVALAAVLAMHFGLLSIDQTRPALVQAPAFQADVGKVSLGTENRTVAVPKLEVERADQTPAQ
jgi:hypothetical protein